MPQSEGESVDDRELVEFYNRTQPETSTPRLSRSAGLPSGSRRSLRTPPPGTPPTRARMEAGAAPEQAEELGRLPEEMGRELRGEVP
jgi:hypothetical protein